MVQFPINIQTFPLSSGTPILTYWRCDFKSGAWTAPVLVFDLGVEPTFFYNQGAGATADGTDIGLCIAHSVNPPDATTLESCGDGPPDPVYDASAGNTVTTPSQDQSTGEFLYKGNWYEIVTDLSAPNVHARKSIDNRATWNELDAAHFPSSIEEFTFFTAVTRNSALRRSLAAGLLNKIDLFCTNQLGGPNARIFLYTFDLDTEKWTGPYGVQDISVSSIVNGYSADEAFWRFSNCVIRFPNGDLAGFYQDGSSGQLSYRVFDGATWGAAIDIPNLFGEQFFQAIVDAGDLETIHLMVVGIGPSTRYFTCTHTGVVTLRFTFPAITGSFGGIGHGVSMSGILYIPVTDSDDVANSVYSGPVGGALTKMAPLPVPPSDVGLPPNAGSYMVDWLPPSIVITIACPIDPPVATIGVPYNSGPPVVTGGTPPYTFSIIGGSLPPGFTLDPATGVVSGITFSTGVFNYTLEVTDSSSPQLQAMVDAPCPITVTGGSGTSPCVGVVMHPETDVQFKLIKVIATLKEETHLPVRGSVK